MQRRAAIALTTVICTMCFAVTPAALAQREPLVTAVNVPELVIADQVVMRLRARAGGLTSEERANSLRQRLGPILTLPNLSPEDVAVRQRRRGQTAAIYVRRRLLITVDRNLADANNSRPGALAEVWARNLRRTLPLINVAIRIRGAVTAEPE